jgi:Ring finger domain
MAGNFYDMFAGVANSAMSHASSHFDSQFQSHMRNTSFPANGWTQQNNVGGPQTTQNYKMAPPASKKAIKNLAIVQVTADDLIEESNKECLICLCEQKIGSTACKLACGHLYHRDCLTEWLEKSCTCKQHAYPSESYRMI